MYDAGRVYCTFMAPEIFREQSNIGGTIVYANVAIRVDCIIIRSVNVCCTHDSITNSSRTQSQQCAWIANVTLNGDSPVFTCV